MNSTYPCGMTICGRLHLIFSSLIAGNYTQRIVAISVLLLVASLPNGAQAQLDQLEIAERFERVTELLKNNKLVEARPLMNQLLPDVEDNLKPNLEFYIALSWVFEFYERQGKNVLERAEEGFTNFLEKHGEHSLAGLARYNLADVYAMNQKYKEALSLYIPIYRNPLSDVDPRELLNKIVLIYVAEKEWEAGGPFFADSLKMARNETEWATAAAYLLISQAKQGSVSESAQLLDFFLSPAPVFYTPRFNSALMEVGDQLRESGNLVNANMFYQVVRDYDTLNEGLTNYIKNLERQVEKLKNNLIRRNEFIAAKAQLDNARADLEALKSSENYTPLLQWRIARAHMEMGRDWEAFYRFRQISKEYPDHQHAETILYSAFALGEKVGLMDATLELGKQYLKRQEFIEFRSNVADTVSKIYVNDGNFDEHFKLTLEYLADAPDNRAARILLFNHAVARMNAFQTRELIDDFLEFRDLYATSGNAAFINYFLGLSYLIEQENQEALSFLKEVVADPDPLFRADASFRIGQALVGLDELFEARKTVEEFIRDNPDHVLRATAELTLGSVVDMLGDADTALIHYNNVERFSEERDQLAQADLKIAAIFQGRRQEDLAIDRLSTFLEKHGDYSESIPVSKKLADIYEEMEKPRLALQVLSKPVKRFFEEIEVYQVDSLLIEYLRLDRKLRATRQATSVFLSEVGNDRELLEELIGDRGKQFRYFNENPMIDPIVNYSFIWDNEFRGKVLENAYALRELQNEIDELNASIPDETPEGWLMKALMSAQESDNVGLAVRIECALAMAQDTPGKPSEVFQRLWRDEEKWSQVGLEGKLWILESLVLENPKRIIEEVQKHRASFMNTDSELRMYLVAAAAHEEIGQYEEAVEAHHKLIKRFVHKDEAALSILKIGELETNLGNFVEARKQLEPILYRNEWRGEMHAKALISIGRAYAEEGLFPEAHGFFERIILGYPGFPEILAMAFYEDIRVLKQMGEFESVKTTHEAFVMTPGLENTEAAQLIRDEMTL